MRCASGSSLASAPINTSCALVRQERSFTGDDVGKTANPPRHFSRVAILYEEGCPTQDVCSVIEPTAAYRTACQMQNATAAKDPASAGSLPARTCGYTRSGITVFAVASRTGSASWRSQRKNPPVAATSTLREVSARRTSPSSEYRIRSSSERSDRLRSPTSARCLASMVRMASWNSGSPSRSRSDFTAVSISAKPGLARKAPQSMLDAPDGRRAASFTSAPRRMSVSMVPAAVIALLLTLQPARRDLLYFQALDRAIAGSEILVLALAVGLARRRLASLHQLGSGLRTVLGGGPVGVDRVLHASAAGTELGGRDQEKKDLHAGRRSQRLDGAVKESLAALVSAPLPPVHLREEQVLPFRGALLDPGGPVHELGGAQDAVRRERED